MEQNTLCAREPTHFRADGADRHGQLVDPPPPQQPLPQPGGAGWGVRANRVDQLIFSIDGSDEAGWNEEGMHGRVCAAAGTVHRGTPGLHRDVQPGNPSTRQSAPAELDDIADHRSIGVSVAGSANTMTGPPCGPVDQ